MDLLRLSLFMLIAFVGCVECTDPDDIPDCNIFDLAPCTEEAVRSYTRNTRGEAAAQGDINPQDAQTVGIAISTDFSSPSVNMNETCKVIRQLDYQGLTGCIADASTGCRSYPPSEEVQPDLIPSLRYTDYAEYRNFDTEFFCAEGCLSFKYNFKAKMAELIRCWKVSKVALAAAQHGYVSVQHCSVLSDYMQCQWDNVVGCSFLEEITRVHLLTLITTIAECDIQLPKEALRKTDDTTEPPITASSAHVTPHMAVHISVLFVNICVICGRSSIVRIY